MSRTRQPLYCIAHRGGRNPAKPYSENTLPAFKDSIAQGVDAIEIDVWKVGGELLVTHDRLLGKLLPGRGRLLDYAPEYLRNLRLPCGNQIPTLEEVLATIGQHVVLNIEIKGPDCASAIAATLRGYIHDTGGSFEQYLVSSFDHPQLYHFKQLLPEVRRGALIDGIPLDYANCCAALDAYSLHPGIDFISQPLIDDAKQRGLKVWVYTVNEPEDFSQLASMGIDGVFTDFPEQLIAFNQKIQGIS